ncbi:hypothetical protein [Actinomycetospora termitidis]|uniref:Integral membrane protein n=1 Tax=Actinomycetospora termitidis TaxID=3053470 RepID=A0ABT7MEW6_9PSEU|nr:hypothetical protein [Actinomycetospora sp. Odt1-22]MDL5158532.1 hypothetical protein [Actinomycetospora sp. Odt1-22]
MTIPAYSGRHSTFDATTVLPAAALHAQVPPAGAPPGRRPGTVDAVFFVAVAQAVAALAGAAVFALILLAVSTHPPEGAIAAAVVLGGTALADAGWLLLAWRVRAGGRGARVVLAVLAAVGLLIALVFSLVGWTVLVPLLGVALNAAVLVLLFAPASNAWFRVLSPAPGPGSPRR